MSKSEANELNNGLYIIDWADDENYKSVAAVGRNRNGDAWYAPTNWITVPSYDWELIHSVKWIMGQKDANK